MKHLARIQVEFLKEAREWDEMSYEEQKDYLKRHRKSKRQITAKPQSDQSNLKKQIKNKREKFKFDDKLRKKQMQDRINAQLEKQKKHWDKGVTWDSFSKEQQKGMLDSAKYEASHEQESYEEQLEEKFNAEHGLSFDSSSKYQSIDDVIQQLNQDVDKQYNDLQRAIANPKEDLKSEYYTTNKLLNSDDAIADYFIGLINVDEQRKGNNSRKSNIPLILGLNYNSKGIYDSDEIQQKERQIINKKITSKINPEVKEKLKKIRSDYKQYKIDQDNYEKNRKQKSEKLKQETKVVYEKQQSKDVNKINKLSGKDKIYAIKKLLVKDVDRDIYFNSLKFKTFDEFIEDSRASEMSGRIKRAKRFKNNDYDNMTEQDIDRSFDGRWSEYDGSPLQLDTFNKKYPSLNIKSIDFDNNIDTSDKASVQKHEEQKYNKEKSVKHDFDTLKEAEKHFKSMFGKFWKKLDMSIDFEGDADDRALEFDLGDTDDGYDYKTQTKVKKILQNAGYDKDELDISDGEPRAKISIPGGINIKELDNE